MYSPKDFDNPTILLALVASVCVLVTMLVFLLWLRRADKPKPRHANRRKKTVRSLPKNRAK